MSSRPFLPPQERFRALALDPERFPAAHMALAFELRGEARKDLLEQAFRHAWQNADASFYRYDLKAGTQTKGSTRTEFSFVCEAAREADVKKRFVQDFERAFDLTREAPLRFCLLETKPKKSILGIVAHHVALDGWSLARLLEKATDAYNALVRGEALPNLPWEPFEAYAAEYERQTASLEKSAAFWAGQEFSSAPLLKPLPPATRGHRVIYILNKKYYQKIRELAKAEGVTPFLFLLTCFTRAAGKVLARSDLTLSVPIASRDWDKAEFVIGNCVNLIPLKVELNADPRADIQANRDRYLDSLGDTLYPFALIQQKHAEDLSQFHFNFEPSVEEPKLDGLEIEFYPYPITQVEKPLIINVNDTKKTYYVEIDYQFQALDLVKALTTFTEAERVINQVGSLRESKP